MPEYSRRQAIAAVGSALTVGLAGCSGGGGSDDETTTGTTETTDDSGDATASVRVAHLAPDAPDVNVSVDGDLALEGVSFQAVSDYLSVPTGTRTLRVTAQGDEETNTFEGEVDVTEGTFTIAAVGELVAGDTEFRPLVLTDDTDRPADDTARVRLVHASPDAPGVDVTVAGGQTLFDDVAFGGSGTVEVPAGTYTLQVRPDAEDDDAPVVAEYPVEFAGGTAYTGFAGGYYTPGDEMTSRSFDLSLSVDTGSGGGFVDTAGVRVAHMSPDAPAVDVAVDGESVLTGVPFRAVSDYLQVPVGTRRVTLTEAGDRSGTVFDQELSVDPGNYTLVAAGELGEDTAFEVFPLTDDTAAPGESDARLRVVHVSPDAPAVDVTVAGGPTLFDGLSFGSSEAVTVDAGDYTAQVRPDTETDDGDVVYDADLALDGATAYTAFASGYLSPGDDSTDEPFELAVTEDATD